jgi:hypothetical protein
VALPPGVVRTVNSSLVTVPPLVAQRHLGAGSDGAALGRTKGAKRVVAVDVAGLSAAPLVVPASTLENRASEPMLEHLDQQGVTGRLELVLVDRGVTAAVARALGRSHEVEVAHGRVGRARRLAKSFETTTSATGWLQVACIATTLRHLSRERVRRHPAALAA